MTTPLDKPVRRQIPAATMGLRYGTTGTIYIVEISKLGISFREKGRRFTLSLPWRDAFRLSESLAGDARRREIIRDSAIARSAGGAR